VLGDGQLEVKLDVKAHRFSAAARAKIEAAGGTCTVIQESKAV
jgi:large subunit ribosomal protein L15